MRVLRPAYGSRGGVEPLAGLAVPLRAPGTELRVCARPDEDFAVLLAGGGVPRVPFGPSAREMVSGATPRPELPLREVTRLSRYGFQPRQAERYRDGRILLREASPAGSAHP